MDRPRSSRYAQRVRSGGSGRELPYHRLHPAIVAQAAPTTAAFFEGRFFLGVGTGENLNEHITGQRWPSTEIRREMLAEAVELMRKLWEGGLANHRGRHYTVENARLYTLPDGIVDVIVAAGGPEAADLGAQIGDGIGLDCPRRRDSISLRGGRGNGPGMHRSPFAGQTQKLPRAPQRSSCGRTPA